MDRSDAQVGSELSFFSLIGGRNEGPTPPLRSFDARSYSPPRHRGTEGAETEIFDDLRAGAAPGETGLPKGFSPCPLCLCGEYPWVDHHEWDRWLRQRGVAAVSVWRGLSPSRPGAAASRASEANAK